MKTTTLFKTILGMSLGLMMNNAHGFFFKVEKHDNIQQWSNNNQSLYLVSDYHFCKKQTNKCADKQQQEVLQLIKDLNAAVVVEDGIILDDNQIYNSKVSTGQTYLDLESLHNLDPQKSHYPTA